MTARPELGFSYTHFHAVDLESGEELEWGDDSHDWEGDLLVPLWVKLAFIGTLTLMWRREALTDEAVRMGAENEQFGDDQWPLMAVSLSDRLSDGVSMVYSFYDPDVPMRSLGTYMILEQVEYARQHGIPYVYLGYWIEGSRKMRYKNRFQPQEQLTSKGWVRAAPPPDFAD